MFSFLLMKKTFIFGILGVFVVSLFLVFGFSRAGQERVQRRQVEYVARSTAWWDDNMTEAQNIQRRVAKLKALGPIAVKVFRQDLNYDAPPRDERNNPALILRRLVTPNDWRLHYNKEDVRASAAHSLESLGPDAKAAIPDLLNRISDADRSVRLAALHALGAIGQDTPELMSAVEGLLEDSHTGTAFVAAFVRWRLKPTSLVAFDRLQSLITSANLPWASYCFLKVGPPGQLFAPALSQAMKDMPWSLQRMHAVHALWVMTNDRALVLTEFDTLKTALRDPDPLGARNSAGWSPAEEALGYAAHMLDDDPEFREAMKPLLSTVLSNPNSKALRMASTYAKRFLDWGSTNDAGASFQAKP
jgi:HEAT repeat protein